MADLANEEKPAIAPPVFVFQKDKAQKRSADGSSAEDGEDSEREESEYCPPVKRERTSSLTQFPPSNSEEKPVGFRLKPPTLIHGQAPSAGSFPGVPSQKPKEQQRSVLRPAVLQAPPTKTYTESKSSCGTNGVGTLSDGATESPTVIQNNIEKSDKPQQNDDKDYGSEPSGQNNEKKDPLKESSFVFGQNIRERAKVEENSSAANDTKDPATSDSQPGGTNYFLQYIGTPSSQNATNNTDKEAKFVFGQNMSERVLSPPKGGEGVGSGRESPAPVSEPSSQEATPEKASTASASAAAAAAVAANSVAESLEESAAAYTKATAKKCILEKVEVRTGEESESNVLQMQCKLFVFDKTAQSWIERGRGLLRLNDMASTEDGTLRSRLVMRTQGSLRLILNTKLWPQMQVDKASEKSVRITAMDTEDQGVKVFLISASSKDAGQLAAALHHRILALKSRAEQEPEPAPLGPEPEVPQSNEDDSDDEPNSAEGATANTSGTSEGGESQEAGGT
ncbi:ran-binding protein 3b isoform X5 [Alosa sapidissima]|uniref:ran-binding protein 3b isoform X5 n=1 Tax=Alosa sapidissima TaxID=34773 RepID=UPI001C09FCD1|nr:ran-binding protein 3b isoform X5 [Alosa sapidissima]